MIQTNNSISVIDLEKSFKNVKVLKGINLTVKRGSIFALLGSNGAGKTTMIKILTTLLRPDKGSAKVCGFDVALQSDLVRGQISLTGQSAAVDEILTGRENLRMIGKLRHIQGVNNKVDKLLQQFHLLNACDQRVASYSGGMRRKLDLAMSLIGNPSVVFLDEPTTGLDPQSRNVMWKIIKDLSHSGVTVFLTTQYLDEADHLADQIAILNDGKIVAKGTAAELKRLIPHGHIELGFADEKEVQLALDLLNEYNSTVNKKSQTLTVETDGSIKQITNILNLLENSDIPIAVFSQKLPSLEDVFLTIIGENKRNGDDA